MEKVIVDVDKAIETIKAMRAINVGVILADIEFQIEGKPVSIDPSIIEQFSYLGLNNTDFIRAHFMREEFFRQIGFIRHQDDDTTT